MHHLRPLRRLAPLASVARLSFLASVVSLVAIAPVADAATESANTAPDPLQWPGTPTAAAPLSLPVDLLRNALEQAGNAQLCAVLMTQAKQPIPANFNFSKCPASFASQVNSRQGLGRWAAGSKPTECGTSCVGRPSATRGMDRDRPNANMATVSGSINIEVDVPGPNRTVYFAWNAFVRCAMPPTGSHQGNVTIDVVVDRPVVGDPSFWESAINFFLGPADWSRRITDGIQSALSTPGSQTSTQNLKCSTVGPQLATLPKNDAFLFDVNSPLISAIGRGRTATVRLVSITRKPVSGFTPPVDPGSFSLFINGVPVGIPMIPAITALPISGGTAALNMCKTIDMDGANRLQIILTNTLGGTTWSQFGSTEGFGAGKAHSMTTARNAVVPGHPLPNDPHPKPVTLVLGEFELTYTIDYYAPAMPGRQDQAGNGAAGPRQVNPGGPAGAHMIDPPPACRQL